MKSNSIRMIAFDLFGVILCEGHLISNGLMPLLPQGTERKQVKALYEQYNVAQIKEAEFWSFANDLNVAQIRQQLLDGLETDPNLDRVISQLKARFQLSILSNLPAEWADIVTDKFQLSAQFNPCLFSGHLGIKKPDRGIYQTLLKISGLSANEIVFIDDRLSNLQTAHDLGMQTVYFQREHQNSAYVADFTIRKLTELLDIG